VTEASFLAAFAGGVLSLLAPCSALLLPAFFANAFTSPAALLGRTLLFLAGLSTVFVPLGLGAPLVGALLIDHRETTIPVAGLLLIGFGVLELVGAGFSPVPSRFAARFQGGKSGAAIYGTGVVYGISGFCAGPLLGAVLTIAGSAESPLLGGALLFAWLWDPGCAADPCASARSRSTRPGSSRGCSSSPSARRSSGSRAAPA
jgi:cytochrome c biogenesis protein CcdA